MLGKLEQSFAERPWHQVHESMQVKLAEHEGSFTCWPTAINDS